MFQRQNVRISAGSRDSESYRKETSRELETTIFYWTEMRKQALVRAMIWNHPTETTISNWLFRLPGPSKNVDLFKMSLSKRAREGRKLFLITHVLLRFSEAQRHTQTKT